MLATFVLGVLGVSAAPGLSFAQSAPQMQVQVDEDTVGVGDVVHLVVSVTSAEQMPTDAQPGATPGFAVRSTSASPSQTHMSVNGVRTDRYTLTVDWALVAQREGTFKIGPPTVVVGASRYVARGAIAIRVVPAGRAPPRAQPQQPSSPWSPFDPWKQFFPNGAPDQPPPVAEVTPDPRLSLDAPRGAFYFLHATVDKPSAVVGEQVTFSVYEYIDAAASSVEVDDEDVHDPRASEFVKHALLRDDNQVPLEGYASAGGRTWVVKLVRRWALFPLHAGDLEVGPMSVTLLRPRSAAGAKRASETIRVRVTEPPLAGRPPGYALGDVGRFAIEATVSPREAQQGGAVAVHVEVSGTGNVPSAIAAPARNGVEWLAPEVHEQLGPIGRDAFGGKRSFDYVVRVSAPGPVELGEVALAYWNPDRRAYDVARAPLGRVVVTGAIRAAAASSAEEMLPGLPPARDALDGTRAGGRARWRADDSSWFWWLAVGGWPAAFGAAVAGRAIGSRTAGAWRRRRESPEAELRDRVAAARAACEGADARAADAAIARALEAATLARAGVNVRGAVGDQIADRLHRAGVERDAASRVADLFRECEAARFDPSAADLCSARARWQRARDLIKTLSVLCVLAVLAVLRPSVARADDEANALFVSATTALHEGRAGDAVASLEALADRGVVDAAASYDRGLAYAARVRMGAEQPGDLGRAAHGFEEARDLASDARLAEDASRALTVVRAEIVKRRTRTGEPVQVDPGRSMARSLAQLQSEGAWTIGAAAASAALGVGLFVRWLARARRVRIGGGVAAGIALPALALAVAMTLVSRHDRLHLREAVVVSPAARPLDDRGVALAGATTVPEGARVEIVDSRAASTHVRFGAADAWIASAALRPLARADEPKNR